MEEQMESVKAVFSIPLLVDTIVKYSIYTSNRKRFNKETISAVRLVNKNWLQSASGVLKTSGDWIIKLKIGNICIFETSLDKIAIQKKYEESETSTFNKFVSVFSKSSRSTDSVLPMCLQIDQLYLTEENKTNVFKLFEQFSDMVSELWVKYPIDGGSLNLKCPNLNFPILKTLKFTLEEWRDPDKYEPIFVPSGDNANGLKLLKQILIGSQNLNYLTLTANTVVNFGSITLPESIKGLDFSVDLTDNELVLLNKNKKELSNLNSLRFLISTPVQVPLLYKILEKFTKQLTNLCVTIWSVDDDAGRPICIVLPVMKNLKCFKLLGDLFSVSPGLRHVCPTIIPNVTQLALENQSENVFLDGLKGRWFENVKKFKLSLNGRGRHALSPNDSIIQEIKNSFPKIEELSLKFSNGPLFGLVHLFYEFTCLKKLRLDFDFLDYYNESTVCNLVSYFLGISSEKSKELVDGTAQNVSEVVNVRSSIMNLTELKSLTLWVPEVYHYEGGQEKERADLCSHVLTKHGLSKMPNLLKIKFKGGFQPEILGP